MSQINTFWKWLRKSTIKLVNLAALNIYEYLAFRWNLTRKNTNPIFVLHNLLSTTPHTGNCWPREITRRTWTLAGRSWQVPIEPGEIAELIGQSPERNRSFARAFGEEYGRGASPDAGEGEINVRTREYAIAIGQGTWVGVTHSERARNAGSGLGPFAR